MSDPAPRIRFVIGGAQKAGTSALAAYLARHPAVRLPHNKEAHVFDAPQFDESADVAAIDAMYVHSFPDHASECGTGALHGDATPIYMFHPTMVRRIARYNPEMRWIVLLRDPVERAISHWHMEHARGTDLWPMFFAMLFEDWRLRGHADDLGQLSPLRMYSYRRRGDYARQLDMLYSGFPRDQVLVLRSRDLRDTPAATLSHVHRFLGVTPMHPVEGDLAPVFEGQYVMPRSLAPTRLLLRALTYRMRRRLRLRHGLAL